MTLPVHSASIKKEKGTAILNGLELWSLLGIIIDKPVISEKSKMNIHK